MPKAPSRGKRRSRRSARKRSKPRATRRAIRGAEAKRPNKQALRNDAIPRVFLGRELQRRLRKLGLTQQAAARIVDDAPSQISRLMTGHLDEFSADRLAKMLLLLGSEITITVRHNPGLGRRGRVKTKVA
jgi:predicted XRE-type DNA-binding protein